MYGTHQILQRINIEEWHFHSWNVLSLYDLCIYTQRYLSALLWKENFVFANGDSENSLWITLDG
jgi:hypothetical protein